MRDGATRRTEADKAQAEERYRELVRLVYFILPGTGKRTRRMAMACRIVESTGALGGGHDRLRTRVLRRAMRPSPLWRIGLRPWLRRLPPRLPPVAPVDALAALKPRVRVAYVLLKVAGMSRYEVRDQLLEMRVPDQMDVIEEAERAEVPPIAMRPHADPFGPGRIAPVGRRPAVPVTIGVAVTATLLGAVAVAELDGGLLGGTSTAAARDLSLVAAAPDTWRTSQRGLDVWPARGDLAKDKAFTARVLKVWGEAAEAGRTGGAPDGDPQLLFAGRVDGREVALVRRGDRIGRFTGHDGKLTVTRAGTDPHSPLPVARGRYLVAPWDRVESLDGRKLRVQQGVTDAVFARTSCGRGPVMNLSGGGRRATVGEFGGPRAVPLTYRPATYIEKQKPKPRPQIERVNKAERLKKTAPAGAKPPRSTKPLRSAKPEAKKGMLLRGRALRVWERVACVNAPTTRPVAEATAWEFWSGAVPLGGGAAQWVCTGMDFARPGSSAQAVLLDRRGTHRTGWCDDRRPVGGSWWRSARGDWYYLAAAARGLAPHAQGPFRRTRVKSGLLTAVANGPDRPPADPVSLSARPN